jgi:hypothetical protein
MRKRIIERPTAAPAGDATPWLDLERAATVEVTSEAPGHPVEAALVGSVAGHWQADGPGQQTLRLCFDQPQALRRIRLVFFEPAQARTQEFVLRWSADGVTYRDIVRQQYNFSQPDAIDEQEQYDVVLDAVSVLELTVVPDIGGGSARASLAELRLA